MTDKTRDKLLISMAILLHEIVEKNPSLVIDRDDNEALWMAITKATAEHHRETREQNEHLTIALEDAEILRNIHNENTLVGIWPKEVVADLQEHLKAMEDA